ncbi:MAG: hypothetical protein MJZ22_03955 [Candidatus Saccharibacteria bacterium]|nr:hypothetical protein [Candidatus Saccharibacteria bacterium]
MRQYQSDCGAECQAAKIRDGHNLVPQMICLAFLFKKFYAVNMMNLFSDSEAQTAVASQMFKDFNKAT